eukprot:TRINITY_DN26003_c0_g1_i1.p2 TRINITY_DN26003_c0_g1~~TRINITY_DN26003_c0_g1_i1.p2  ORF type:complete len:116 (-),score=18.56 TRINITY_DN26003_c0_g1_i1:54-401(-)
MLFMGVKSNSVNFVQPSKKESLMERTFVKGERSRDSNPEHPSKKRLLMTVRLCNGLISSCSRDLHLDINVSPIMVRFPRNAERSTCCLLYTSDAADEEDSVDLGGRRIIKKKKNK